MSRNFGEIRADAIYTVNVVLEKLGCDGDAKTNRSKFVRIMRQNGIEPVSLVGQPLFSGAQIQCVVEKLATSFDPSELDEPEEIKEESTESQPRKRSKRN